jgi:hypothetical protein
MISRMTSRVVSLSRIGIGRGLVAIMAGQGRTSPCPRSARVLRWHRRTGRRACGPAQAIRLLSPTGPECISGRRRRTASRSAARPPVASTH